MFDTALNFLVAMYGKPGLTLVMILQTIVAPIPSEAVLMFAGAIGMDIFDVMLYGGLGTIIGSAFAFFISRYGGRPVVAKLVGDKWIGRVDGWITRYGRKAIFFSRLVPVVPFDLISYTSGLTSMKFADYFIATSIGALPRCLFLAYVGSVAGGTMQSFGASLELIFVLGVSGFFAFAYMERKGYMDRLKDIIIGKLVKNKI
ncbi:MAG: VTT domain-containing protein [Candidatus Aenigmatarchaeota archaeon]